MLSYRAHLLICLGLLGALIAVAAGGNALAAAGVLTDPEAIRLPGLILVFGLFLAFGFSTVPVMVMSVFRQGRRDPNADPEAARSRAAAQKIVIWSLWALMAAGLVVALPAAIQAGFFSPQGPT